MPIGEIQAMREAFLNRLFSMIKCESCGHNYEVAGVEILGHEDNLWLFSTSCSHCQNQGLVAIVVKEGEIGGRVTDLTEAEYERFSRGVVVGVDDVLDMHNFLKGFEGDLTCMLSER
jgi:hypothetical protein